MFRFDDRRDRHRWTGSVMRLCPDCRRLPEVRSRETGRAPLAYTGEARDLVVDLKYRGRSSAAHALAAELARAVRSDGQVFDVVTWAPTSDARRRRRGFDQAETIARLVARELRLPCRRLLLRSTGRPQTGRSRRERLEGPVFRARPARRACRVLVIDDVVTTGATLRAAAHALEGAGWGDVATIAAASTPDQTVRPASDRTRAIAPD